jgi:hypothetical protein
MREIARVTDTWFNIHDWPAFVADRSAHEAIQTWCRRHGVDPSQALARGGIHRDVERCRVVYVGRVGDGPPPEHDGPEDMADFPPGWATCYRQGETPPMPWPAELDRYRSRQTEEPA